MPDYQLVIGAKQKQGKGTFQSTLSLFTTEPFPALYCIQTPQLKYAL